MSRLPSKALFRLGSRSVVLSFAALATGCATIAGSGAGDENLPNARLGPFRSLRSGEIGLSRVPPNVLDDEEHGTQAPSVVDADADPRTPESWGYFAANIQPEGMDPMPSAAPNAVVRHIAADGRSFDRFPITVLEPSEAWEEGTVGAPSALRIGGEIFLYYAAGGGIGLARSDDGAVFTRDSTPVLGPPASGWDAGLVPRSPGALALADGSLRMFYDVVDEDGNGRIGEARSTDGVTWSRVGALPALAPGATSYDSASVGAPFPVQTTSPEGRSILAVYYTGRGEETHSVIGLAARLADDEPLVRATSPVFGTDSTLDPNEPCVVPFQDFTLLFVSQRAGRPDNMNYPAVAGGVAPGTAALPPPASP